MQIEVEIFISAPPGKVFAALLDIPNWPQFMSGITKIEMLSEGPVELGTRFRETRIMFGQEASEEMTVAEIDRPHSLVLTANSHGTAYRTQHLLEPEGDGSRLKLVFEGRPQSITAHLLTPLGLLMKGALRKAIESDQADLKRMLETTRVAT